MTFVDRTDAGRQLAKELLRFSNKKSVLLYALPRGGVVVAAEVAKALHLPFDVIVTRKIGSPHNEEYAIGAIAETGEAIWNEGERSLANPKILQRTILLEKKEATRRIQTYRGGRPLPSFAGKTVILIDDGIATGLTIRAGIAAARHQHAAQIIIAVPHGARDTIDALRKEVDDVITLTEPKIYGAVGAFYDSFPQTSDEEVCTLLQRYASL